MYVPGVVKYVAVALKYVPRAVKYVPQLCVPGNSILYKKGNKQKASSIFRRLYVPEAL